MAAVSIGILNDVFAVKLREGATIFLSEMQLRGAMRIWRDAMRKAVRVLESIRLSQGKKANGCLFSGLMISPLRNVIG